MNKCMNAPFGQDAKTAELATSSSWFVIVFLFCLLYRICENADEMKIWQKRKNANLLMFSSVNVYFCSIVKL